MCFEGVKSLPIFEQHTTHSHKNVSFKHVLQIAVVIFASNVMYTLRDFSGKKKENVVALR